ncbi:MAG: SLC26A/SulP transporter family protein [Acidobacteriota bacterium]|nr:MAG: SLC26A/SulP transporter family protein [Acidobacteriota bacterium]
MAENNSSGTGKGVVRDGLGGLAAAAMLLPQSMAFGVALLSPFGVPAGRAALAGLICAACLSIFSGLAAGTIALVSSPTGPTLVLAAGVLAIAASPTGAGGNVILIVALFVVLTGIGQILIGATGGGRLIKFIPHSVVVGFLTGSAILMLKSQYAPLADAGTGDGLGAWIWIPAATAAVTIAASVAAEKFLKRIPATLVGLVAGTVFFQLAALAAPSAFSGSWTIGALPGVTDFEFALTTDGLGSLPWPAIIAGAAAAAVLGSLDTLLTSVLADLDTGERHDARKELIGQGAGHIASGLLGGMAGAGTTGATLVAVSGGGRRWAGVAAGLAIAIVIVFGGPLGTVLPVAVLAGIIIRVSIGMFDTDLISWLKSKRSRSDAGIAILVAGVTVAYDLLLAVGIGVVIAIVLYLRAQVKAPVIHRGFTARDFHSVCKRTAAERQCLSEHAESVKIYELRGDIFFATADRLYKQLIPDLEEAEWLILNLRRVRRVDITGAKILQQIAEQFKRRGGHLIFCEVHKGIGIGHDVEKALRKLSPEAKDMSIETFVNTDEALEYVENRILEEAGFDTADGDRKLEPSEMDIFSEIPDKLVRSIISATRTESFSAGDKIFRKGDHGASLYFVLEGEVDIRLETTKHHYKRLAKYGPGTLFGEVAFLNPGERTADAVAVTDVVLVELDSEDFHRFAEETPEAAVAFLIELGKKQSNELRWSAHEIQRLGDW